jgi:hypothetical protein
VIPLVTVHVIPLVSVNLVYGIPLVTVLVILVLNYGIPVVVMDQQLKVIHAIKIRIKTN